MKKILFYAMAAIALFAFAACEKEKNQNEGPHNGIALQVYKGGELVFEDKEVKWHLEEQSEEQTFTLFMDKTRFVAEMPMLNMEVRGLVNQSTAENVAFQYETDNIIPYYNGAEYPRYVMTNFSCIRDISQNTKVQFTCAGYDVVYTEIYE